MKVILASVKLYHIDEFSNHRLCTSYDQ